MFRIATSFLLTTMIAAAPVNAEDRAEAGKLLVATDEVRGEIFARTVILLLHYDADGAMGLVINRPTDVLPEEVIDDPAVLSDYEGTLFWGGPVEMGGMRALVRSGAPPDGAATIVDDVHLVPFDDAIARLPADVSSLRLYIGYAGWAPGQLDGELDIGSWDVRDAAGEVVFSEDPRGLWKALEPVRTYRAGLVDAALPHDSFAHRVF